MKFKDRLAKLIDVKTLITLTMLGVFSYLSVIGKVEVKDFVDIFKMIVVFFFGVQVEKHSTKKE